MNNIGFIFDLDGVVVDTAKYHYLAWKKLAYELGVPFTEADNERFKGVSRKRCLEILLEMGGIQATAEQQEVWLHEKNEDYLSYIDKMDESEILPDVPKVLDYLKKRKIPMALGSASKNAVPILNKVKLAPYFQAVVDGTQVSKAKPDPEVFLIAAYKLGAPSENCVVFEDAYAGIQAANSAQMVSVGIGDPKVLDIARYNFRDFTQITPEFLDRLIREVAAR